VLSGGGGAPVHDHFRPAREHDRRPLAIEAAWRGGGVLADLAYARLARRRACHTPRVRLVIRLTDNWQPQVDSLARGRVTQACCPGTDRDVLLEEQILPLDGRAIDADVRVGSPKDPRHLRLVGIPTPKGYGFCLTNLPPRVGPRQVADLYRVRWEVELSRKVDTSVHRLDQIDAEPPCLVKTLLQASLIASVIAAPRTEASAAPPAHRLAAGRLLAVDGAGLGPQGRCGEAALATDRRVAHAERQRSPLAWATLGLGSTPGVETPIR
jgi:hypothetical protein